MWVKASSAGKWINLALLNELSIDQYYSSRVDGNWVYVVRGYVTGKGGYNFTSNESGEWMTKPQAEELLEKMMMLPVTSGGYFDPASVAVYASR